MSGNRIITIILSFLLVLALSFISLKLWVYTHPQDFGNISNAQPMSLDITTEDDHIMQGLWYEEEGDYANSYKVFDKLYNANHSKAYLLKKIHLSLMMNKNLDIANKELEDLYAKNPNDIEVLRLLVTLHLIQKNFSAAKNEAEHLISISNDPMDVEIASNAMLYANDPNKALAMLKKLYDETKSEDIAMRIAIILSDMYHEYYQAIDILEEHSSQFESQNTLYEKLLELYAKTDNSEGVIKTAHTLYNTTRDTKYLNRIVMVAWKYYKGGECQKAQNAIQDINNIKVLKDPETIGQWRKIRECTPLISNTTIQVHK
ncbi:MAG: hypothetical protein PHE73_07670 [Sulfurovaceae bacterium]|nr:hypothetical protein [Sulfurovaceae bacterium]